MQARAAEPRTKRLEEKMKYFNILLFSIFVFSCFSCAINKTVQKEIPRSKTLEDTLEDIKRGELEPASSLPVELASLEKKFEKCFLEENYYCFLELSRKPISEENLEKYRKRKKMSEKYGEPPGKFQFLTMETIGFNFFEDPKPRFAMIFIKVRIVVGERIWDDVLNSCWEEVEPNEWVLTKEFWDVVL